MGSYVVAKSPPALEVAVMSNSDRVTDEYRNDRYFATEHLRTGLASRSIRGGTITLMAQGVKFLLAVSSQIVLARLLTPYDYGLIGMVAAVLGFVTLFKDLGLSTATVQRPKITHEQVSALFWLNVALSAGTALVTIALAPAIAWFYGEPRLMPVTMLLAGGFLLGGLVVQHQALLIRQMRFTALASIELVSLLTSIAAAILAARRGAGYWSLVVAELVKAFVTVLLTWIACPWKPGLPRRRAPIRSMLAFGGNLTGFSMVNYLARNLDNALIGWRWGAPQLGFYTKAYQLLLLPIQQINTPIASVAIPALSHLTDSPDQYRRGYLRVLENLAVVTMPLTVLMAGTSDWLVQMLLGPQWAPAGKIFMLLSIAGVTQPVCNSTGWLFITQNRTRDMFHWGLIGTSLTVSSFLVGLPWGAVGVAAAYSCMHVLVIVPLLFYFVGRRGPVTTMDFYRTAASPALGAVVAGLAVIAFRRSSHFVQPIAGCVAATAVTSVSFCAALMLTPRGRRSLYEVVIVVATLRSGAFRRILGLESGNRQAFASSNTAVAASAPAAVPNIVSP